MEIVALLVLPPFLLTVAGITNSIASKHSGNSCILLDSPSETDFLPARIEHIVQFVSNNILNTMVAIWRFKWHNNGSDLFSFYSLLQTQIWWSCELGDLFCLFYNVVGRWTCHGHGLFILCASSFHLFSITTKIFHRNFKCSMISYLPMPLYTNMQMEHQINSPPRSIKTLWTWALHFFYEPLLLTLSVFWRSFLWSPRANQWHQGAPRDFPSLGTHLNIYFPPLPTFKFMLINYSMVPTKALKRTQKPPHSSSLQWPFKVVGGTISCWNFFHQCPFTSACLH